MAAQFYEVAGVLGPHVSFGPTGAPVPTCDGRVVLSNLSRGAAESRTHGSASLKYVASGAEVYRYGRKTYPVPEGNFLYVPEAQAGDVEIGRSVSSTLGLCVYLPATECTDAASPLDKPMIFPAACSDLGRLLDETAKQMLRSKTQRPLIASGLLEKVLAQIEPLMEETVGILDGMEALKPATRHETLRRLNVARGYLHSVTDRVVELAELARVAGISRFQLLRSFRNAFGAPPGTYHRALRLRLAKQEIDRSLLSCSQAAHRFGFADCSSFSHAYRRMFGEAPMRNLAA